MSRRRCARSGRTIRAAEEDAPPQWPSRPSASRRFAVQGCRKPGAGRTRLRNSRSGDGPEIDVADTGTFDLPTFKTTVKDGLNKKLGEEVITEVLVEQLEYLTKDDVKRVANSQNVPRQKPVPIVDKNGNVASDKLPEGAVKASSTH